MNNETKKLQIQIPNGYVVDTENSDLVNGIIKFKPIAKRWRDDESQHIEGYFIHSSNSDISGVYNMVNSPWNHNVFAEEKMAKSALAMARISQIMKYDKRFGGVVTDEEWSDASSLKYTMIRHQNSIRREYAGLSYNFLAFHTEEQRDLFLDENEDLIKEYLMID